MTFDPTVGMTDAERRLYRIRRFHQERVEAIRMDESHVRLSGPGRLIIHLVPEGAFHSPRLFTAADLKRASQTIRPLGDPNDHSFRDSRFNVDGFLLFDGRETESNYCQLYRSGLYEGVMASAVYPFRSQPVVRPGDSTEERLVLREHWCEEALLGAMNGYLPFAKTLALEPPFWMFAALIGCNGARICVDRRFGNLSQHAIDRSFVWLPEMKIDTLDTNPVKHLRPMLDVLWNAVGFERSFYYDEQGNRRPRQ